MTVHIPRPVKVGERMTIGGVVYRVVKVKQIDATFYECELKKV